MNDWTIQYTHFDPDTERVRETLCTLGNGYFASRGAAVEARADGIHYPGTYLAGGYNRLKTKILDETIENEDFINFPNGLFLNFKINDSAWFQLKDVQIVKYAQTLNMQEGILHREVHFVTEKKYETYVTLRKFVSMADPHSAAIEMRITALNWDGNLVVESALDGQIENGGVARYMQLENKHLENYEMEQINDEILYLQVRTNQSHIHVSQAIRTRFFLNGERILKLDAGSYKEKKYISTIHKFFLNRHQPLLIEKSLAFYTSKDHALSECGLEARRAIVHMENFEGLFKKHARAWHHIWKRFDIKIESNDQDKEIAKLLRLHLFHLLQTTSMHTKDLDCGVPSRGLHGEAYRGHILWDELFIFPTLNLQFPELTRALLLYRYRRLPMARQAAKEIGLKGAMYPWQSGSDGREESQKMHLNPLSGRWIPDNSRLQRHVNSAIAYNIWQHFEVTDDLEFLTFYGAEMLLEIARFWVSLSTYNSQKNRYEILGVMGPDEYHDAYPNSDKPGINNNAYTNVMAAWVLKKAWVVLNVIPKERRRELEEILYLNEGELCLWKEISTHLFLPFHEGVISQFEGYETLQELNWEYYQKKYGNIQRLDRILEEEGLSANAYKVSKQADVLMLFYLFSAEELRILFQELGYDLSKEMLHKTIEYYMTRTSHGSSLSQVIHSWVLSRSSRELSWNLCKEALQEDFGDRQGGTTAEGIHLGAMAGTVDLIQRCYSGLEFRGNVLRFHPCLPNELKRLQTIIRYRGHSLIVYITHDKLRISSERATAQPIQISYEDQLHSLIEGQVLELVLNNPVIIN